MLDKSLKVPHCLYWHANQKRCVVAESEQSQSQTMENIDHSSVPRPLSKCNESMIILVHHLFIVDQSDILQRDTDLVDIGKEELRLSLFAKLYPTLASARFEL